MLCFRFSFIFLVALTATMNSHFLRCSKVGVLSRVGSKGPRVGKYGVHVKEFEELALPCMRITSSGPEAKATRVVVVDEIGKMELFSKPFMAAYRQLLDQAASAGNVVVVSTIAQRGQGFIQEIKERPDVTLLTITKADRDAKCEQIIAAVNAQLRSQPTTSTEAL